MKDLVRSIRLVYERFVYKISYCYYIVLYMHPRLIVYKCHFSIKFSLEIRVLEDKVRR